MELNKMELSAVEQWANCGGNLFDIQYIRLNSDFWGWWNDYKTASKILLAYKHSDYTGSYLIDLTNIADASDRTREKIDAELGKLADCAATLREFSPNSKELKNITELIFEKQKESTAQEQLKATLKEMKKFAEQYFSDPDTHEFDSENFGTGRRNLIDIEQTMTEWSQIQL